MAGSEQGVIMAESGLGGCSGWGFGVDSASGDRLRHEPVLLDQDRTLHEGMWRAVVGERTRLRE